jgi:hypothetical protein
VTEYLAAYVVVGAAVARSLRLRRRYSTIVCVVIGILWLPALLVAAVYNGEKK